MKIVNNELPEKYSSWTMLYMDMKSAGYEPGKKFKVHTFPDTTAVIDLDFFKNQLCQEYLDLLNHSGSSINLDKLNTLMYGEIYKVNINETATMVSAAFLGALKADQIIAMQEDENYRKSIKVIEPEDNGDDLVKALINTGDRTIY